MNFQKYILCDDPVENILEEGQVTGFRLRMMQGAYKGTRLSYFQDIVVLADGERFSLKVGSLTFTLASGSYGRRSFPPVPGIAGISVRRL